MQVVGVLAFGLMTAVNLAVLGLFLASVLRRTRIHH
jgi:hypothetical protein